MKVWVIYDLPTGGGLKVLTHIVEALVESNLFDINLVVRKQRNLSNLERDIINKANIVEIRNIPLPHPYSVAAIAKRIIDSISNGNIVILVDDVPKILVEKKNCKIVCYVNYPHALRSKIIEEHESIVTKIHKKIFRRFFVTDFVQILRHRNVLFLANSTRTKRHMEKYLQIPSELIKLVYPPVELVDKVDFVSTSNAKQDLVVSVQPFDPNKKIEGLIHAVSLLHDRGLLNHANKVYVIGYLRSLQYFKYLTKIVEKLKLNNIVKLIPNANRNFVEKLLEKSKVYVHTAPFEPFGIAVVEALAKGCLPIVRRGFNGPWIDITKCGRYSLGYNTIEELAINITKAFKYYPMFDYNKCLKDIEKFSPRKFKVEIIKAIKEFLTSK